MQLFKKISFRASKAVYNLVIKLLILARGFVSWHLKLLWNWKSPQASWSNKRLIDRTSQIAWKNESYGNELR